jgi:hypothetical protein
MTFPDPTYGAVLAAVRSVSMRQRVVPQSDYGFVNVALDGLSAREPENYAR